MFNESLNELMKMNGESVGWYLGSVEQLAGGVLAAPASVAQRGPGVRSPVGPGVPGHGPGAQRYLHHAVAYGFGAAYYLQRS